MTVWDRPWDNAPSARGSMALCGGVGLWELEGCVKLRCRGLSGSGGGAGCSYLRRSEQEFTWLHGHGPQ